MLSISEQCVYKAGAMAEGYPLGGCNACSADTGEALLTTIDDSGSWARRKYIYKLPMLVECRTMMGTPRMLSK